jgi:phage minor structural protein
VRQIKLFIFDLEEKLVATLENKDANSCPVEVCQIKETLNGVFSLEFEIPNTHDDLKYIKEKYFVSVKDADDKQQLFVIQEINDSHENELNKRVFCDHASIVELGDEIIEEVLIDRKTSSDAFPTIMMGSKWEIGTLETTTDVHDLTARIKSRLEVVETFLNRWGVEVSYEVQLGARSISKRLIHIEIERGVDIGKRIEYGHNMETIERTVNADTIKTALYGIGKEVQATSSTENEATTDEENEINEEKKRYVDFGGVDWSTAEYTDTVTGTTIVDQNILPLYQTYPTRTTDLNPWTWGGGYKVAIIKDAPSNVGSKSYQITQTEKTSDFVLVNTAKKKTACVAGTQYGFSAYVKPSTTKTMVIWAEFYDARGKMIDGTIQKVSKEQSVTGGAWTRLTLDAYAPTGAKLMMIEIRMNDASVNQYFRVTGLNITKDTVREYVQTVKKGGNILDKPHGQRWIGDETARLKWGRYNPITGLREHRFGIYKNSDIEDPEELLLDTHAQLPLYTTPQVTYEAREIALGEILGLSTLKTRLGDYTIIVDRDLDITLKARAMERESDLIDESNSTVVFGDYRTLQSRQTLTIRENIEANLENQTSPLLPETTLEEGQPIYTEWLEGEINALKNELIAGSGTVTITETNGILIETLEKDKALRLLGGMLAMANERDPVTGEYNWRSFGTGEGFLADLVNTGFIRFDRAKGGQLTLGGEVIAYDAEGAPIYENGSLVVYGSELAPDGRPTVVSLNGDQGGFAKLSIGELTNINGTNIVTSTFDGFRLENQVGDDIHYYVDPVDGDDNNNGTKDYPRRTIQSCIDDLPKYLERSVYIYVLPTLVNDPEIIIDGIMGHGYIYIELWDVGAQVRYVRDYLAGSTANNANHWVEVYGVMTTGATRHAGGDTYPERVTAFRVDTGADVTAELLNKGRVSNGDTATGNYSAMNNANPREDYVQVYLGGVYDMEAVVSNHYYSDGRTYHKTKIQISDNLDRWYTVFDSARQGEYAETSAGKRVELKYFLLNGRIKVNTCMVNIRVNNAFVNGAGVGNPTLDCFHSNYVESRNSVYFGDPAYNYVVYANGSNVRIVDCEVNISETSGIISAYGGRIEVYNVKGSGFPYALHAHSSGVIGGGGMSPIGSTAQKYIQSGGTMSATWTATGGEYFTAPITQKTSTWTANDTQSLYGTNWTLTSHIYQGKRPTETTAWYGVMFFNARDFSALAGRAIKSVRVKIQRTNDTGENTARKPKFYYNMQSQAGGSIQTLKGGWTNATSFTWGQEKWCTLPIEVGEAFRDGTALSLVLYVGTSESSYMRFEPKATLEIVHG